METRAAKLVQRCLSDVARNPVENVSVYLADDITVWHLALHFPEAAPFVGGPGGNTLRAVGFTLYATLRFGEDFPTRPPRLKFLSPWINHQHLWGDRLCHSLLTDDFLEYFRERATHGTSMWNAACALADGSGIGGMPRYLQVLREYLGSDPDYDEEQHVRYDDDSLQQDVAAQRAFRPEWLETAELLEMAPAAGLTAEPSSHAAPAAPLSAVAETVVAAADEEAPPAEEAWGIDFFLKSPLVPGSSETHPCFDVTIAPGRVPSLSTTMTTLCERSFELGACTTDFGTPVGAVLPYPCSYNSWVEAGSAVAAAALANLAPVATLYRLYLPSVGCQPSLAERENGQTSEEEQEEGTQHLEAILNVIGEIWKTTCIGIVKEEGYESERAMTCFVTLHFLLLCFAKEHPRLQAHAATTVRQFLELIEREPEQNLKTCVPDLGRFLARFLLTEGDVPLRGHISTIVRELFNRNVRWVDLNLWARPGASPEEQEEQVQANFEKSHFGMKLTVFQSYYILRSMELGLVTLQDHEACGGKPTAETLHVFQEDCRRIKELSGFGEFFRWLQLDDSAEMNVHKMLCDAVVESNARGYNGGLRLWA